MNINKVLHFRCCRSQ